MASILHLITSLDEGGAENILCNYILSNTSSHTHTVVAICKPGKAANKLSSSGIMYHSLFITNSPVSIFRGLLKYVCLIQKIKPSIVHSWLYHANLLASVCAFFLPCRQVWGIHNSDIFRGSGFSFTFFVSCVLSFISHLQRPSIIYCAKSARTYHTQELHFSCANVSVVYNGLNLVSLLPQITDARIPSQPKLSNESIVFGCVARYHPIKNHELLLHSFAGALIHNPRIRLVLVGDGINSSNHSLVSLIRKLNLQMHVQLLGHRTDIAGVMCSLDFHILTSKSEAFPTVILESMACGTPCISTDVGDSAFIISNTGWICPQMTEKEITNAILEAASCSHLRYFKLATLAKLRIRQNFSISTMASKYDLAYDSILVS